jgi:hypothetical protein
LLSERYGAALRAAREGRAAEFAEVLGARGYYTEDVEVYRRALTRLALECSHRSLARRALEAGVQARSAGAPGAASVPEPKQAFRLASSSESPGPESNPQ